MNTNRFPVFAGSPKGEVVLSVRDVSKKFCRSLRRSMAYGIVDLSRNLVGRPTNGSVLRKDEFWALRSVNFELRRGETLGLIGVNGSGKTTLLRLLAGILPPDMGEIVIHGRVGALIALGAGFHPHLTGRENIYLNGSILGLTRREIERQFDEIIDFAEIGPFIDAPVSTYSSGMRVRLGFAIATAVKPDILLIDEVLAVGDIGFRTKCFNKLHAIASQAAVVLVSHSMPEVARVASHILLLQQGRCVTWTDDVHQGIEDYLLLLPEFPKTTAESGLVRLKEVRLLANGTPLPDKLPTLPYRSDLTFQMDIEVESGLNECGVVLTFLDRSLSVVAQCSSRANPFLVQGRAGTLRARVCIPQFPLTTGVYSLTVNIGECGLDNTWGRILGRYDSVREFRMTGSPLVTPSPVLLEGNWCAELPGA